MIVVFKYWKYILISVAVVFGLLWFFVFRGSEDKSPTFDYDQDYDEQNNLSIDDRITEFQANEKAKVLEAALLQNGTDEDTVIKHLKNIHRNDYIMISNAFGEIYYNSILGSYGSYYFGDEKLNLIQILKEELSNKLFNELNLPIS